MKSLRLFSLGERGGPWYLELVAFDQDACLLGVSGHRYMDCLNLSIHPLPFVDLNIILRRPRLKAEQPPQVRHVFRYGDHSKGPRYFALCVMPWGHLTMGATWYRDQQRFELCVSPLPRLTFFYTRVKGRHEVDSWRLRPSQKRASGSTAEVQ